MTEEPSSDDMKNLWRNQPSEPPQISLDRFRRKSRKLRKKGKREVLIVGAIALFFLVVFIPSFLSAHEIAHRVGLGILIIWAVCMPLQAHRKVWPGPSTADVALTTCVELYRRELERHRDYTRYVWRWAVGPLLLGVAIFSWPTIARNPALMKNAVPFFSLLVVWVVLAFRTRRRRLSKLHRKIDQLDALKTQDQR